MAENNTNLEQELAHLRKELATRDAQLADAHSTIDDLHDAIDGLHAEGRFSFTPKMTELKMTSILGNLNDEFKDEIDSWVSGPELSAAERRRLQGASQRRYGFIDEISDIIPNNPQFLPSNVNEQAFKDDIRKFELIRNINITLLQVLRTTQDIQLVMADNLYRQALSYYGAVRDAALRRVEGAQVLFDRLRQFFRRTRPMGEEPTEPEVERDVRSLLHGKKEGEVIIRSETPHLVGGNRTVIDETHKAKANFKIREGGEIEE